MELRESSSNTRPLWIRAWTEYTQPAVQGNLKKYDGGLYTVSQVSLSIFTLIVIVAANLS